MNNKQSVFAIFVRELPPNLCENNNVMKVTPLIGSPVSQNNDYIKVTLLILGLESQNNE